MLFEPRGSPDAPASPPENPSPPCDLAFVQALQPSFAQVSIHKNHNNVYSVIDKDQLAPQWLVRNEEKMIRKTRLFTPGPTPLLPAAQFAMAAADMHHRTPEFRAIYQKVLAQLKVFVGTQNDVLLLSSSGTGAMEAAVSNLTSPGDRVLVLTAGKFGERWVGLAKAFGCEVDLVERSLWPDVSTSPRCARR